MYPKMQHSSFNVLLLIHAVNNSQFLHSKLSITHLHRKTHSPVRLLSALVSCSEVFQTPSYNVYLYSITDDEKQII